jgi:hypothetical protein
MFKLFLTTAALSLSMTVHSAELLPVEKLWVSEYSFISQIAKTVNIKTDAFVVSTSGFGVTPVFMAFDRITKVCRFGINIRNTPGVENFMDNIADSNFSKSSSASIAARKKVYRFAMIAHEFGHCIQHINEPGVILESGSSREQEAFADVFALSLIRIVEPESFETAAKFFVSIRTESDTGKSERYDILKWVEDSDKIAKMTDEMKDAVAVANKIVYGTTGGANPSPASN